MVSATDELRSITGAMRPPRPGQICTDPNETNPRSDLSMPGSRCDKPFPRLTTAELKSLARSDYFAFETESKGPVTEHPHADSFPDIATPVGGQRSNFSFPSYPAASGLSLSVPCVTGSVPLNLLRRTFIGATHVDVASALSTAAVALQMMPKSNYDACRSAHLPDGDDTDFDTEQERREKGYSNMISSMLAELSGHDGGDPRIRDVARDMERKRVRSFVTWSPELDGEGYHASVVCGSYLGQVFWYHNQDSADDPYNSTARALTIDGSTPEATSFRFIRDQLPHLTPLVITTHPCTTRQ